MWTVSQQEQKATPKVRSRISVNSEMADFISADSSFLKTVPNCLSRQARPMFDPTKSLLLGRCDDYSVPQQTRCRIGMVRVDPQDEHGLGSFPMRVECVCAQATAPGHLQRGPQSQSDLPSRCCDESQTRSAFQPRNLASIQLAFCSCLPAFNLAALGERVERAFDLWRSIWGKCIHCQDKI